MLRSKVLLSPNPASEQTTLYTSDLQVHAIEILNNLGQKVQNIRPSAERNTILDTSSLVSGIYTICIRAEEGVIEKKLVVK